MTDHLSQIKQALEAGPTEGPWYADRYGGIWRRHPSELYQNGGGIAGDKPLASASKGWHGEGLQGYPVEANSNFIAACNPAAIRSLIERLEAAERDAELLKMLYENIEHDGHCYWPPDFPVNSKGEKPSLDDFRASVDFYLAPKDTK